MKRELLRRISVTTTHEAEDAVAELLSAVLHEPAVAYFDIETGVSTVTVYVRRKLGSPGEVRREIAAGLRQIKNCGLKISPGKITIAEVRQEDWAASWKRHFRPIEIGGVLLIKPSWSKRKPRKGQVVVVLDPGLSFGTGQHPTTAFCLNELVKQRPLNNAAKSFLDLGTGSGILVIAAAKLGYRPVLALDLDPEAIRVACANARANGVRKNIEIRRGDVTKLFIRPKRQGQRCDLVCANLTADVLVTQRRRIAAQLNPSGKLVLAGILTPEFAAVQKAYEDLGLKLIASRGEKEWRSGLFRAAKNV